MKNSVVLDIGSMDAEELGRKLVAAFKPKKSREHSDRWILEDGWGSKTLLGVGRSVINMVLEEANKAKVDREK